MPYLNLPAAVSAIAMQADADVAASSTDGLSGTDWIIAGGLLLGGFVLGSIVSKVVAAQLNKEKTPAALSKSSKAIGSLAFAIFVIAGLIAGLGIIDPPALDDLKSSLISYIPRALSATIVVIGASVASELLSTILERSLGQLPAPTRGRILSTVKTVIMGFAVLIAASQLGVDTTIVQLAAAALFFGIALAAALMVGLGSRDVAAQLAAGRALRRTLAPNDHIRLDGVAGRVVELHATSVEIATDGSDTVELLPNSTLLDAQIGLDRGEVAPGDQDENS